MKRIAKIMSATLFVVLAGSLSSTAQAGGGKDGCNRCGCGDSCAVARLTKSMTAIEVTCFGCEEDVVVLPGKSCRGDKNCETACTNGGKCGPLNGLLGGKGGHGKGAAQNGHGHGGAKNGHGAAQNGKGGKGCGCQMSPYDNLLGPAKQFVWFDWTPGCATTRCVKRLVRQTVVKHVPSYEWVVEDLCKGCDKKAGPGADIEPGSDVPPPPPVEAKLRYRNTHNVPVSFDSHKKATLIRLPDEFVRAVN